MSVSIRLISGLLFFVTVCVETHVLTETLLLRTLSSFFVFYGMWLLLIACVSIQVARRKTVPRRVFLFDIVAVATCSVVYIAVGVSSAIRLAGL